MIKNKKQAERKAKAYLNQGVDLNLLKENSKTNRLLKDKVKMEIDQLQRVQANKGGIIIR